MAWPTLEMQLLGFSWKTGERERKNKYEPIDKQNINIRDQRDCKNVNTNEKERKMLQNRNEELTKEQENEAKDKQIG